METILSIAGRPGEPGFTTPVTYMHHFVSGGVPAWMAYGEYKAFSLQYCS